MKYAQGPGEISAFDHPSYLGPLTNPAGAKRQLIGVFHPALTHVMVQVLKSLGSEHVLAVHGEDGLDEISLSERRRFMNCGTAVCMDHTGLLKNWITAIFSRRFQGR